MSYMNDVVIHYFRFRHDGSGWYDTISVNGLDTQIGKRRPVSSLEFRT